MLFRITAYLEKENISVIMDSDGKFEKLWEFSVYMRDHGFKILEVDSCERFLNGNIKLPKPYPNNIILRACHYGKPIETTYSENGITYRAIQVNRKVYVPDRTKRR